MGDNGSYRKIGYQKGFADANKTRGKLAQNIDRYLNAETKKLSIAHANEFITGWYEGFNDGAIEVEFKSAPDDDFWKSHINWENPLYKNR